MASRSTETLGSPGSLNEADILCNKKKIGYSTVIGCTDQYGWNTAERL
jgi:hypothetical protein